MAPDAGSLPDAGTIVIPDAGDASPDAGTSPDAGPLIAPRYIEWRGTEFAKFSLDHLELTDAGLTLAATGGASGSDMNGAFTYGELVSPEVLVATPFREAVASWNLDAPPGSWLEVRLRARVAGAWTTDYVLGIWSADSQRFARHSVDGQLDSNGKVATDTLQLNALADAFQLRIRLATGNPGTPPTLWAVGVSTVDRTSPVPPLTASSAASDHPLDVPVRSQMVFPNGGERWCSPTSTSMVLEYWSRLTARPTLNQPVPTVAAGVYDDVYGGTGNWPFNTAYAAELGHGELRAFVTRLWRIEQLERLTASGVPVVISISFSTGALTGAPISSTAGHLIVVRGFDGAGDVFVNDPAGPDDAHVRYTYRRAELDAAWAHSGRTAYIIHPAELALPTEGALGSW